MAGLANRVKEYIIKLIAKSSGGQGRAYAINNEIANLIYAITNVVLTTNVATFTTSAAHSLKAGQRVYIGPLNYNSAKAQDLACYANAGVDPLQGWMTIASVTSTTFLVNITAANIGTVAATGTVTWYADFLMLETKSTVQGWFNYPMNFLANLIMASGKYVLENAQDSLTAFATGGQTNALAITGQMALIGTVATAGDSVKLPASVAGLEITLINKGANSMQVFGAGTDTIDDIATATGVPQMPGSAVLYFCTAAGKWYSEGLATGFAGAGLQSLSFTPALTAFATGGQGSAVALPSMINRISVCATQGDSVKLPASAVGLAITVINNGAQPAQVFGAGTDTINSIATATGISQGANTTATYICMVAGNWIVPLSSLISPLPTAISASGAVNPHVAHNYVFTKAGIAAMTLAAPTAGVDDGVEIQFTSDTANAHAIVCPAATMKNGGAAITTFTFTGTTSGGGLLLQAFNGTWKVLASSGGAFS